MSVAIDLGSGFLECLLLVMAFAAVRGGRRIYLVAAVGLAALLYARMADGFIPNNLRLGLAAGGLVVAGVTVLADLLFEVVPEAELEAEPPV